MIKPDQIRSIHVWGAMFLAAVVTSESAGAEGKPSDIVNAAKTTFGNFRNDPNMGWFRHNVKNAKAVLIVPELLKAGFIFGGSGGTGVLLAKDPKTATW